jgi:hypothetical protein
VTDNGSRPRSEGESHLQPPVIGEAFAGFHEVLSQAGYVIVNKAAFLDHYQREMEEYGAKIVRIVGRMMLDQNSEMVDYARNIAERAEQRATAETRIAEAVKASISADPLDVRVVELPMRQSVSRKEVQRGPNGLIVSVTERTVDEDVP